MMYRPSRAHAGSLEALATVRFDVLASGFWSSMSGYTNAELGAEILRRLKAAPESEFDTWVRVLWLVDADACDNASKLLLELHEADDENRSEATQAFADILDHIVELALQRAEEQTEAMLNVFSHQTATDVDATNSTASASSCLNQKSRRAIGLSYCTDGQGRLTAAFRDVFVEWVVSRVMTRACQTKDEQSGTQRPSTMYLPACRAYASEFFLEGPHEALQRFNETI
jgi:hypothetical protein